MKRLPSLIAFASAALLIIAAAGPMVSCGARSPLNQASDSPRHDAATDTTDDATNDATPWRRDLLRRDTFRDDAPPEGDLNPQKDSFIWPDAPPLDDVWPTTDLYPGGNGSPYGCAVDADCLHLRCCPTAWGVKICMPRCP